MSGEVRWPIKKIPAVGAGMTNQIPSQNYSSHSGVHTRKKRVWICESLFFLFPRGLTLVILLQEQAAGFKQPFEVPVL
jgi:hypothetical protein